MKRGMTLEALGLALAEQEETKQDYLVDSNRLRMESGGFPPVLRVLDQAGEDCMEPMELNATAHRQLGGYLRIPASYYGRMLQEDPELLAHNVNRWLNDVQEPKLMRTMNGTVRALLSNRYWCVDHLELLRVAGPVFDQIPGLTVRSCGLTESRMYVEVINQRLQQDVVPGDTVQYGIIITNSEVGMGAISIQPLIYRLVCTNGMVVSKRFGSGTHRIHKKTLLEQYQRVYQAAKAQGTKINFCNHYRRKIQTVWKKYESAAAAREELYHKLMEQARVLQKRGIHVGYTDDAELQQWRELYGQYAEYYHSLNPCCTMERTAQELAGLEQALVLEPNEHDVMYKVYL